MTAGSVNRARAGSASIIWTLFGLEALYNSSGQQRGGMLRAVRRGASKQEGDDRLLEELAKGPCNTNPILSGYIAGILIREAGGATGTGLQERGTLLERCRTLLAPLAAAMGDRLFWGSMRPALSLACLFSVLFSTLGPAVLYCLGYNVTQVWWRRRALFTGLGGEQAVRRELRGGRLERASAGWGSVGRIILGLLAGVLAVEVWTRLGPAGAALFLVAGLSGWGLASSTRIRPILASAIGLAVAMAASAAMAAL